MLNLSVNAAPRVNPFSLLKTRKANKDNEFWCGGLFRFLITPSLRDIGSTDRMNGFPFVNALYEEHNNQSTADRYKSYLCFLMIANWNMNKGSFDCLFVYPIEWNQTERQRTAYTKYFAFQLFPFFMLRMKTKISIKDDLSILLFFFLITKHVKETRLSFSYFLFWNRKTKNERTVYTTYDDFPLFHFSSC